MLCFGLTERVGEIWDTETLALLSFVNTLICVSIYKNTYTVFTSSFHQSKASNIVTSLVSAFTSLVSALKCFHLWDTCKTQYRCTVCTTLDSAALMHHHVF
jgi:hypothetical protein